MQLKKDFPEAVICVNGAVKTLETAEEIIAAGCDGVMVGREAYQNPWILTDVDARLFGDETVRAVTRSEIIDPDDGLSQGKGARRIPLRYAERRGICSGF